MTFAVFLLGVLFGILLVAIFSMGHSGEGYDERKALPPIEYDHEADSLESKTGAK